MTLSDAIKSIVGSRTLDACKRPAMGGYFFRSAVSEAEGTEGDYTLTLRKRANSGGSPVDYVYSYDASQDKWTAPSEQSTPGTNPVLSGEFFGEMIADDWLVGKASDFESARVGGNGEEW